MANNKDFKVKNGIQPTAYHEAVGTVTSGSEGGVLSAATYEDKSLSVSGLVNIPVDVRFSSDGTKVYILSTSPDDAVYQYSLTTAWDISTASYDSKTIDVSSSTTNPIGFYFKADGTSIYVASLSPTTVFQWNLTTAWDISTVSSSTSYSASTEVGTEMRDVLFKPDGTKMYLTSSNNDAVYQYSLSTAWDVSTASYDSKSFSIASFDTTPNSTEFNSDGTKFYLNGQQYDHIRQFSLSTAYDISTASDDGITFDPTAQETSPFAFTFGDSGDKLYVIGSDTDSIYQYSTVLTTNTLDLSTGSVFEITPSSSVKIDISNPSDSGTVSGATLILDGVAVTSYEIDGSGFDGVSFEVSNEEGTPSGIFFKPDGTKMYICGYTGDEVNEYDLSPPWDITSATALNVFSVSGQDTAPVGIAFKTDGTEMYMVGQAGDDVTQYTLSVAWDISSINPSAPVTASKALTGETTPEDVRFKPDGTKMYVCGSSTNAKISEYALSTAWDLSTATYTDTINISAQGTTPKSFDFSSDGTKVAVVFDNNNVVRQYDLSTAWDISTATFNNVDVSTVGTTPQGLIFKSNGEKMYIADSSSPVKVYQFNVSSAQTITYDSSIEWEGGSAPASPAIGTTDVITFITRDGGTSYQAKQVIDGAE